MLFSNIPKAVQRFYDQRNPQHHCQPSNDTLLHINPAPVAIVVNTVVITSLLHPKTYMGMN